MIRYVLALLVVAAVTFFGGVASSTAMPGAIGGPRADTGEAAIRDIPGATAAADVSCPTLSICWSIGYSGSSGIIERIVKGAPEQATLTGTAAVQRVSCATTTICETIAYVQQADQTYALEVVPFKSGHAQPPLPLPARFDAIDIDCPTLGRCVLAGVLSNINNNPDKDHAAIAIVHDGKVTKPRVLSTTTGGSSLTAVSCTSAQDCVTVGWGVFYHPKTRTNKSFVVRVVDGQPQAPAFTVDTGYMEYNGLDCAAPGDCLADGFGNSATSDGFAFVRSVSDGQFNDIKTVNGATTLGGVACADTTHCSGYGSLVSTDDPDDPTHVAVVTSVTNGLPGTANVIDTDNSSLGGADCAPGGTACTAVGGASNASNTPIQALAYTSLIDPVQAPASMAASPAHQTTTGHTVTFRLTIGRLANEARAGGKVQFARGGLILCAAAKLRAYNADARAKCTVKAAKLGTGTSKVTASYPGNLTYSPVSKSLKYTVTKPTAMAKQ